MNDSEKYDQTIKILHNLLYERDVTASLPTELETDTEFKDIYHILLNLRQVFFALSSGDLDYPIQSKGYLSGTLKSFQAALKHLTWQTNAIALGDFTQKVDFMGEFSKSFNSMTSSLDYAMKRIKKSEEEYKLLFENAVESIAVIQNHKIMICNPMFEKLTGYEYEELKNCSVLNLIHPHDQTKVGTHTHIYQDVNANVSVFRMVKKDKTIRWVEIKGIQIDWNEEKAILYFFMDITERKIAQDNLKKSEEKYRLLAEYTSDVIWVYNLSKKEFVYISPSIYYLTGMTTEEVMEKNLLDTVHKSSYENVRKLIYESMEYFKKNPTNPKHNIFEVQQATKNGDYIWVEISSNFRYNSEGEVEMVGVSRSIEKRKKTEEQIVYLSYHDELTGLYNRRYYEDEFFRIDKKENLPISLIMADVNGLKLTNDAFGHLAGDELLRKFSTILKKQLKKEDVVARIGGDEFVILLKNTDSLDAEKMVNRIKSAISEEPLEKLVLSASFGISTKNYMNENLDKIYRQAEYNMYHIKLLESKIMKNNTILAINKSLFEKSEVERIHSENVSKLCMNIGIEMGLGEEAIEELRLLGLFHDIGKIGVNEMILNKTNPLSENEIYKVRRHPEIGYQILRSVNEYANLADYVLSHHERIDGKGYPRNLKRNEIPMQSKILSVAEAYDYMVQEYPFKKKFTMTEAVHLLKLNSGTQFDETVVKIFIEKVLGEK